MKWNHVFKDLYAMGDLNYKCTEIFRNIQKRHNMGSQPM